VRSLASIAENEVKSPGRKILIWSGPGWPMMAGANYRSSTQDRQRAFDTIVEISTRLREAQIAIYNVSISESANGQTRGAIATQAPMAMPAAEGGQTSRTGPSMGEGTEAPNYKEFVKGVKTPRQAETANLALQVMAVQSGGRVLDPTNDLAAQITKCVQEMNSFYTVSFRPAPSDHPEEYHEVTVQVARPGVAARTFSGYYSQP
jgi:VWFA-related protein